MLSVLLTMRGNDLDVLPHLKEGAPSRLRVGFVLANWARWCGVICVGIGVFASL